MLNDDAKASTLASECGTVLSDTDRPSYLFYVSNRAEMDEGAITSWPSVRSLYWLMRQRATALKAFNTEMQGDPRTDQDKVFGNITFWVQRIPHWIIFGACDPSMGRGETSDPSAIVIGGLDPVSKKLHVMEGVIKRRVPSKLEADLITAQREFKCRAIAFENNNAYEHSRQAFIAAGLQAGEPLPLIGVTATVPAEVRIDSLEPYITDPIAPSILLHPKLTMLLAELDTWPEPQTHHHYDGLNALHLLWWVAITRGAGVFEYQTAQRRHGDGDPDNQDRDDHGDDSGNWGSY